MSPRLPPTNRRLAALLRAPMAWIALALLVGMVAATAALALELYASTSAPMVVNPR